MVSTLKNSYHVILFTSGSLKAHCCHDDDDTATEQRQYYYTTHLPTGEMFETSRTVRVVPARVTIVADDFVSNTAFITALPF